MDIRAALRDPMWQSVAAFIGLAALVAAIVPLMKAEYEPLQLAVVHEYTSVNVGFSDVLRPRVELRIDGVNRTQSELAYQQFRVTNVGSKPIAATDFLVPLTVIPQENEEVLGMETQFGEKDIQKNVAWARQGDGTLTFVPKVLAPGEDISVVALIDRSRLPKGERSKPLKIGAKLGAGTVVVYDSYNQFMRNNPRLGAADIEVRYRGRNLLILLGFVGIAIYLPLGIAARSDSMEGSTAAAIQLTIISLLGVCAAEAIAARLLTVAIRPQYYYFAVTFSYLLAMVWLVRRSAR